ncbi:50S ribosomal protein L23 [Candidatus Peregrinibacteria bacterium]|nr:MAG: 50S ribosomal protein L23 [Candidatus Peregrinibacteria bacterium]
MNIAQTILKPIMTEKSVSQEVKNKFSFIVHDAATKVDVKNALMELYGVKVDKVNILHGLPKFRLGKSRKPMQKRAATRRAIVTLKAGEKLDLAKTAKPSKSKAAAASN